MYDNSCYNSSKHYYLEWFCGPLTWVMFNTANADYICVRKLLSKKNSFFLYTFLLNLLWYMEWTFTVLSFSLWLWVDSEVHNSKKYFLLNLFSVCHRNGVKDTDGNQDMSCCYQVLLMRMIVPGRTSFLNDKWTVFSPNRPGMLGTLSPAAVWWEHIPMSLLWGGSWTAVWSANLQRIMCS